VEGKCCVNWIIGISRVFYVKGTWIWIMLKVKDRFRVIIIGGDEVIFLFEFVFDKKGTKKGLV
jgi:hypothetical protein